VSSSPEAGCATGPRGRRASARAVSTVASVLMPCSPQPTNSRGQCIGDGPSSAGWRLCPVRAVGPLRTARSRSCYGAMGIGSIDRLFGGSPRAVSPDRPGHLASAGHAGSPISVQIGVTARRRRGIRPSDGLAGALLPLLPVFWTSDAGAAPLTAQPKRRRPGVTPSRRTAPPAAAPGSAAASKLRALALSHPGERGSSR